MSSGEDLDAGVYCSATPQFHAQQAKFADVRSRPTEGPLRSGMPPTRQPRPQNHPRHLNQASGTRALSTIIANPKGYPPTQFSSGIYLKFIP
jgi:hypothetical protein